MEENLFFPLIGSFQVSSCNVLGYVTTLLSPSVLTINCHYEPELYDDDNWSFKQSLPSKAVVSTHPAVS